MLTLIIEASGTRPQTRIDVDELDFVGTCVAFLVKELGYPQVDATEHLLVYQLRPVISHQPLPNMVRFSSTDVRSFSHFVLELQGANDVTLPVQGTETFASFSGASQRVVRRWKRRSVIAWALGGFSFLGISGGFSTAFAQRYLFVHTNKLVLPPSSPTLRGVDKQFVFSAHQQTVRVVAFSPDGTLLASGGDDRQVIIWRPIGFVEQRITHQISVHALAWSPESQRVMTGSGTQVAFFHGLTGALLARSTHDHTSPVSSVAWTPHSQMQAVSAGMDKRAIVWETTDYQAQTIFARHTTSIEAISWGSDGHIIATASQGGVVRVWNALNAQEIHGFYDTKTSLSACAFALQGTSLAVADKEGRIRIWNGFLCQQQLQAENAGLLCQDAPLQLQTTNMPIRSLAWSPDSRYLAAGLENGSFSVWRPTQSLTPLFTMPISFGSAVHSLSWSPHGNQIATASGNTVIIWNCF